VACWLRPVGPSSLRGTKVVAALAQGSGWEPGAAGCTVAVADTVRLTVQRKEAQCVAPGKGRTESVTAGTLTIDATLTVGSDVPASARFGVACLDGADAASGYGVDIAPDGGLELWKRAAGKRDPLATAKPRKPVKPGTTLDAHVTCQIQPDGVDVTATVAGTTAHATDHNQPLVRRLSPRLVVEAHDAAPVVVAASAFTATIG
jgi:hypothetical protein